ncbi:hypothetical protein OHD57_05140 [Paenibacillus polysaccharolyticus]
MPPRTAIFMGQLSYHVKVEVHSGLLLVREDTQHQVLSGGKL